MVTGVRRLEIQNYESSEPENITYTEVVKKKYLERESMKEISRRSSLSEDKSPLTMPLFQDLGHCGMTEAGNRIV